MTHSKHKSPADILMYGHKASGGSTAAYGGSMPSNEPHFKKGGSGRPKAFMRNGRYCHAEGDLVGTGSTGVNPVNGYKYPGNPENKNRGGRACHAEGDTVEAVPYKKGRSVRSKRRRHDFGDSVNEDMDKESSSKRSNGAEMSEGEEAEPKKRGGVARHREHHNFGDTIGKIASFALPLLSFLKKGGPAHKRRRHHSDGEEVPLKRAMGGAGKVRKGMMRGDGSLA